MRLTSNSHRKPLGPRPLLCPHLILVVAVSLLGNTIPRVARANGLAATAGTVSVRGSVNVNGRPATDGQTLFTKSTIQTGENSDSVIVLANRAQLHLSALGELSINSSDKSLIGALATGRVLVSVPAGVSLDFNTADLSITKQSNTESVLFAISATECEGTKLEVVSGQVEAHTNGRSRIVESGNTLSTATPPIPQTPQNSISNKKKLGIIFGIAGAVAILLAVTLHDKDQNQESPGGGCVIILSGTSTGC